MVWLSAFFIPFVCNKWNHTETMPIVVVGNANPLWKQMPSPQRSDHLTWLGLGKYRCVNLDQSCTFIFVVPDCLTKSSWWHPIWIK